MINWVAETRDDLYHLLADDPGRMSDYEIGPKS